MDVFSALREYSRDHVGVLSVNCTLALIAPALQLVLLPSLYGKLAESLSQSKTVTDRLTIQIAGAFALLQVVETMRSAVTTQMVPSFDSFVKTTFMRRVLEREDGCHTLSSGEIVYMLATASDLARVWLDWVNNHILPNAAILCSAFFAFIRLDATLTAILFALLGATMVVVFVGMAQGQEGASDHTSKMSSLHNHIEDLIRNADTIRTLGTTDMELGRLEEDHIPHAYAGFHESVRYAHMSQTMLVPVIAVFLFLFLRRCAYLYHEGRMEQSQFISSLFTAISVLGGCVWITNTMGDAVVDASHMRQLLAIVDGYLAPASVWYGAVPSHRPPADQHFGMIDVNFRYGDHLVLDHLSVMFARGTTTALVGDVGRGKSTILKLLLGLCSPLSGDLFLDGSWYGELGSRVVRERMHVVPQSVTLFDQSILYNVRYGNEATHTEDEVRRFIQTIAGDALGDRMDGANVGPGGQHISGGQRQLVWCLRILLRSPKALILDEPTASMDASGRATLMRMLEQVVQQGCTVVVVSHDPVLIKMCSRTVDLSHKSKT